MKNVEETLDENSGLDEQQDTEELDLNKPLKMKMLGSFVNKTAFLNTVKQIKVINIGKSTFNPQRKQLAFEMDGQDVRMDIADKNLNEIIAALGDIPSQWIGKSLYVTGKHWTGVVDGNNVEGVQLTFSKVLQK